VGYSADVEVVLESRDHVLRIPTSALLEGSRVLLYQDKTRKLEARSVKTGIANWQYTEILQGLNKGDRIVTSVDREGVQAGALVSVESSGG